MKKKRIFSGVGTALITPFFDAGIDFDSLARIIDFQINAGIDALIVAGTTGEASTLDENERYALYEFAKEKTSGKIPLILGTGTNDTSTTIKYTKRAAEIGADAALVVTPYYNKGTADGIILHYKKIADCSDLPIILYNVPSRTGVNLSVSAVYELSQHRNIVAIKEASDYVDRLTDLSEFSEELDLYSGNDSAIYTTLSLGGKGVISVASNIAPKATLNITQSFTRGDTQTSLKAQKELMPLCRALFLETNPAPIKYLMNRMGFCSDKIRLPLTMPSDETKGKLNKLFVNLNDI